MEHVESSIVKDFQNLRVLASLDLPMMDDLVRDFTLALEESSSRSGHRWKAGEIAASVLMNQDGAGRKLARRRRYKKRKSTAAASSSFVGGDGAILSEASESSLDDALKGYIENMTATSRHSDSDDFHTHGAVRQRLSSLSVLPSIVVPLAESDSVTENFSPMRPQRRRRYFKRMAVDQQPGPISDGGEAGKKARVKVGAKDTAEGRSPDTVVAGSSRLAETQPGKRKRSMKDKSDNNSLDLDLGEDTGVDENCQFSGTMQ